MQSVTDIDAKKDPELYRELKLRLAAVGFFDDRSSFYLAKVDICLALYTGSYAALLTHPHGPLRIASALLLSFLLVQLGFLGHDAGHCALSGGRRVNDLVGFLGFTVMSGIAFSYWRQNHN